MRSDIDSCGESGEFHTVVVDGPIFSERVPVVFSGQHERDGYVFLDVTLGNKCGWKFCNE